MNLYLTTLSVIFFTVSASAQTIISININETSGRVPMSLTDLAGAPGVRVENWNNMITSSAPVSGSNLIYENGDAIDDTFSVSFSIASGFVGASTNINDALMYTGSSNATESNGVSTITLSNIPFAQYDIYVYAKGQTGGGGRGGSTTVDGDTFFIRNGPAVSDDGTGYVQAITTSYTPGVDPVTNVADANYAYYGNLSGLSQTIDFDALMMGDATNFRFQVYGFQIVAVPEPGQFALIAGIIALAGLALHRRKR